MIIPEVIKRIVLFIGLKTDTGHRLLGTAFFVQYQEPDGLVHIYVVTCRHTLEKIDKFPKGDNFAYLRPNYKSPDAQQRPWIRTNRNDWVTHPTDDRIDIAVYAMPYWISDLDHARMTTNMFLTDEKVMERKINAGDELLFPGLFKRHPGTHRNLPIVRFGNIAATPSEPIRHELGFTPLYIAEIRSLGGVSGSPAFVFLPSDREGFKGEFDPHTTFIPLGGGEFYLLGIVIGHWDDREVTIRSKDFVIDSNDVVNIGLGTILPVTHLLATLMHPSLVKNRQELDSEYQRLVSSEDIDASIPRTKTHTLSSLLGDPLTMPEEIHLD